LELYYDGVDNTFSAIQPVTVPDSRRDSPLAEESATLDVSMNNLAVCTATICQQYLYEGRDLFTDFRETTEKIACLQPKLRERRYNSRRIQRLYHKRTRRRDHAQGALVRDLMERLYDEGVTTVNVGNLPMHCPYIGHQK
jgi:putative transposase